jgi:hypothetical protein
VWVPHHYISVTIDISKFTRPMKKLLLMYGANHLVTATLGQWPNWPEAKKKQTDVNRRGVLGFGALNSARV